MPSVVPDFETASLCNLKKTGSRRYAEDITTEILCLSWDYCADGGEPVMGQTWFPGDPCPPDLMAAILDPLCVFIAHNAGFEKDIWRQQLCKLFGWPDIPNNRWHDTAARCANVVIPSELEKVLKVLGGPVEKDMEGNRLTLSLSKVDKKTGMMPAHTPAILERVGTYCQGDVIAQRWLHKRIGFLPPDERRVYLLDQEINERGIKLDMPLVRKMQQIVDRASIPLAKEFAELTGGLKMTQRDKVMSWMLDRGVMMPNMKKETLAAVLGETDEGEEVEADERINLDLPPEVKRALHIRQLIGSASIKKLGAMEGAVCANGRAHRLLRYHRAGPGRWAGTIIQPQNFPRGSLKEDGETPSIEPLVAALMTGDPAYVESMYGPAVEAVVSSLRHTIIAEEGKLLVAGDYSTVEARLVLAIAGQHDKLDLIVSGVDIYNDMGATIYGRPIDRKHGDAVEGAIAKNSVLGCGFQMGGPKFNARYCPHQTLEFAQEVVDTYRQDWAPKVPELWKAIENAALYTVKDGTAHDTYGMRFALEDNWLTIRLLSGRKLWYYNPRVIKKAMPWDENDIRLAWDYQATKMSHWTHIDAYGGHLTENVVQATARDLLVASMFKCRKEGLPIVLTVHDEIVLEVDEARADPETLRQIMCDIPAWAREIKVPIAAECWSGERYKK